MEEVATVIRRKINQLFKSNIAKNIFIVSSGSLITQGISFIFSPIITRIFPPDEYGIMSLFASIVALFSVVSSFKYEMALPIEKDEKKAKNLLILCFILLIIFTGIFWLVVFVDNGALFSLLNAEELLNYRLILVFGIFLYGLREIYMQWYYRKKDFTFMSRVRVGQSLIGNVSKVSFGLLGFGPTGLLIGQIIKESLSTIPFSWRVFKRESIFNNLSTKDIKWNIKRYRDYPMYQTPSSFLSILKNQLPVFSLSFYGSAAVGLYGLANTIVKIPMTLLGNSVRNVFYAEAASIGKENPQKLKKLSNSIFNKLVIIGLFPLFILLLLGPTLFGLVFGEEWIQAGHFSRFLAFSVYADFIFSPVSRVYEVLERQKEKLFIDIFGLIIVLVSFLVARMISSNPNIAIFLYSIAIFGYYLIIFLVSRIMINEEIKSQKEN